MRDQSQDDSGSRISDCQTDRRDQVIAGRRRAEYKSRRCHENNHERCEGNDRIVGQTGGHFGDIQAIPLVVEIYQKPAR